MFQGTNPHSNEVGTLSNGAWEFAQLIYMCFVDLKAFDNVLQVFSPLLMAVNG